MDECSFAAAMKTKIKMFILRTHLLSVHVTDIVYFDGTWRRSLGSPAGPCTPQDFVYVLEREKRLEHNLM